VAAAAAAAACWSWPSTCSIGESSRLFPLRPADEYIGNRTLTATSLYPLLSPNRSGHETLLLSESVRVSLPPHAQVRDAWLAALELDPEALRGFDARLTGRVLAVDRARDATRSLWATDRLSKLLLQGGGGFPPLETLVFVAEPSTLEKLLDAGTAVVRRLAEHVVERGGPAGYGGGGLRRPSTIEVQFRSETRGSEAFGAGGEFGRAGGMPHGPGVGPAFDRGGLLRGGGGGVPLLEDGFDGRRGRGGMLDGEGMGGGFYPPRPLMGGEDGEGRAGSSLYGADYGVARRGSSMFGGDYGGGRPGSSLYGGGYGGGRPGSALYGGEYGGGRLGSSVHGLGPGLASGRPRSSLYGGDYEPGGYGYN
jgi:hypothetical protein